LTPQDIDAMNGPGEIALGADGVTKKFISGLREVQALQAVSMQVRKGLVTGLIGPDGAGKTTLMRMAAGLLAPDEGKITVLGIDATANALEVQSSIGYMPQRFGLYEDLTVQENLDLYADLRGVVPADRPGRYRQLMTMTGLGPFTSRLAGRLSGGMKQKLGLACTLVRPPHLLILDEPTVGVDPVSRRELWAIVYRLVREEGMSVLLSTAYLDEAERCDEVVMLHEGRILGYGPPKSFSGPMEGRTWRVRVPALKSRTLQKKLAEQPGVVDAVVQGEAVRLVMEGTSEQEAAKLLEGIKGASLEPVAPRFEDSFIALLGGGRPKATPVVVSTETVAAAAPREDGENIIEVKDLQRRFGDFYAVKRVTFGVRRGEVFGLLGANGAGKSTTFRMLCGLLPASGGSLSVAGVDLRRAAAPARARIGYMSQKFSLSGNLSVRQNLEFFSSAYGLSGSRRREKIDWALEQFELLPSASAASANLPLGFKQRLAMACALMHEPDIIFLDEPTSGVDPLARREFWRRIDSLAEQGVTILVTTHFMEEAEYCDRIAIMAAGEILAIGSPSEIKSSTRTRELPEPTLEDAFITLITGGSEGKAA
jgi:ABC-2 type transport system ATP-binding protein